jgi:hypothetical protein
VVRKREDRDTALELPSADTMAHQKECGPWESNLAPMVGTVKTPLLVACLDVKEKKISEFSKGIYTRYSSMPSIKIDPSAEPTLNTMTRQKTTPLLGANGRWLNHKSRITFAGTCLRAASSFFRKGYFSLPSGGSLRSRLLQVIGEILIANNAKEISLICVNNVVDRCFMAH